jgi:hypothetical protein
VSATFTLTQLLPFYPHRSVFQPNRCRLRDARRQTPDRAVDVDPERPRLIRAAFRLEWLTIGWMAVEAAVAVASGIAAHSITLIAFGLDSVIELASAGVLIWRLSYELRFGREVSEAAERIARRIAGGLLFALAACVVAAAVWSLWRGEGAEFAWLGLPNSRTVSA